MTRVTEYMEARRRPLTIDQLAHPHSGCFWYAKTWYLATEAKDTREALAACIDHFRGMLEDPSWLRGVPGDANLVAVMLREVGDIPPSGRIAYIIEVRAEEPLGHADVDTLNAMIMRAWGGS